ncbi:MAG: HU family DNA-binding protein [Lachnospiraceae bacterium]|nr:HU family DNA-binding protein [Lachnospiraceae bacterium]MDN4743150.1 HU family DNA-binding protein [Lachnospiraceae bacterium C1.1]
MNKAELAAKVAEKAGVSKKSAAEVIDAFTSSVTEAVASGEKVQLIGFGTFEVSERAARTGRNPQTNEEIKIPASKSMKFKAGKAVKEAVNASKKKGKKK